MFAYLRRLGNVDSKLTTEVMGPWRSPLTFSFVHREAGPQVPDVVHTL